MPLIKTVRNHTPLFGKNNYIAENATLIGALTTGDDCSFWFNSVVRADVNTIQLGNKVNVQDGAIIHCTYNKFATTIGNNVSIGHKAIVHGCTIKDNVLIGMGAIVMDGCIVNEHVIVAAGAILTQGTITEPGYIYAGIPAKKIKPVGQHLLEGEIERVANNYVKYASWYKP
ncbi:MAG: gamma carbonic anhydrase family protein [Flavobacteriales bacterium]|jgi:carbonic anhydrase/acetyltransferase-like protein (isoleucine patch superfamily)|nr:gamma carbonic anhydrase family protein [Flavobacteriales bacterium]